MALIDLFDRGAMLAPDRAFLVDGDRRITYREAASIIDAIAARLLSTVDPGSRVAIWSPNCADAMLLVHGIARSGSAWVALNARASAEATLELVRLTDPALVFYHPAFEEQVQLWREGGSEATLVPLAGLTGWIGHPPPPMPGFPLAAPDDVVVLLPTGGTTGRSKAVELTNRNIETMAANFLSAMPAAPGEAVHLIAAPLTHGAGMISFPLTATGATHVLQPRPGPGEVLRAIDVHSVTHLFLPPTVIYLMLEHPDLRSHDYSSLQHFVYAAAPMSVDRLREALDVFGPVMTQVFGQVEAPMMCTYLSPQDHLVDSEHEQRLWSCGRRTLLTPVAIMDDDGNLLGEGGRGEIVVRGDLVMRGYHRDPDATAAARTGPWHHTGDVGYVDGDGYVYIVDRKRDMIITGGFNVFPSEVEQVVWSHPAVQDCAVIGTPDAKWGEAVTAIVEPKPGALIEPDELLAYCRSRLDGVRAPRRIEVVAELPRSPVGKVLKRELRERYWQNRRRAI